MKQLVKRLYNTMKHIEFIVRGVCVKNGKILLCQNKGKAHAYLPGGHIEHRERAEEALLREIKEELGLDASITGFMGCVEATFRQKKKWVAEISILFEMKIPRLRAATNPSAKEGHLDFFWHPLSTLAESPLQPEPLRLLIPAWRKTPGFASAGEGWKIFESL